MLTAVFSYRIFLLSKTGVNQIEFTFVTHFFLWGSVHIYFEVFSSLLIDFFSIFWYDEGADRILRGSRFKTWPKAHIILQESFFCMLWGLSLFLNKPSWRNLRFVYSLLVGIFGSFHFHFSFASTSANYFLYNFRNSFKSIAEEYYYCCTTCICTVYLTAILGKSVGSAIKERSRESMEKLFSMADEPIRLWEGNSCCTNLSNLFGGVSERGIILSTYILVFLKSFWQGSSTKVLKKLTWHFSITD